MERVSRERWIAGLVGFVGVLFIGRPSGAGSIAGMLCALLCAACNAFSALTVRGLTRTESTAAIVFIQRFL
jgi:drug/metabolite transporter (DMT)-like permease